MWNKMWDYFYVEAFCPEKKSSDSECPEEMKSDSE